MPRNKTMYLDISKKVGDPTAVKTPEQLISDLQTKLTWALNTLKSCDTALSKPLPNKENIRKDIKTTIEFITK